MTSAQETLQLPAPRRKWTARVKSGCITCRIRRVKCDEGKPDCGRCRSTGRKCDGYTHPPLAGGGFGSAPDNISGRQRRVKYDLVGTGYPSPSSQSSQSSAWDDEVIVPDTHLTHLSKPINRFPLRSERNTPLLYPLSESWNNHFMPLVLNKFRLTCEMAKDIYNTVPHMFSKAEDGSALYEACNAVARAYMVPIIRNPKAISDGAKAYGSALTAIRSAIMDPQRCKTDNTLFAVWMLGLYELLSGLRPGTDPVATAGWQIHNQVLAELISLRGSEFFASRNGRNLWLMIFSNVETRALMSGQECKEALTWFTQFHEYCEVSEYPVLRACIFLHQCARICSRIRGLVDAGDIDELLSSTPSILRDVDEVEKVIHPFSHEDVVANYIVEPPLAPYAHPKSAYSSYVGVHVLQSNFRMRLSYAVLEFLGHACRAPGMTPQQQKLFTWYQRRCAEEIQALADKLSQILDMLPTIRSHKRLNQGKAVAGGVDVRHSPTGGSPDGLEAASRACERPTRTVKVCLDLEQPIDGKSTLVFHQSDSGISVLRFGFGDETGKQ
ncbi:hypothetical protein BDW59DRAFT_142169 [Aspergillus cavernicola]|uniref:Zn(2)-C6 fungal-type domain-containing protein n=1 Tax=Aspergillus cavernicola TaxID=176166 RepID=A0ABR4IP19_9EURO